jgi:hypothetical protein
LRIGKRLGVVLILTLFTVPLRAVAPAPSDDRLDFYGNGVSSAVAEYRLDQAGSLYEEHAPQIELPRLGEPKT